MTTHSDKKAQIELGATQVRSGQPIFGMSTTLLVSTLVAAGVLLALAVYFIAVN